MPTVGHRVDRDVFLVHAVGPFAVEVVGEDRVTQFADDVVEFLLIAGLRHLEEPVFVFLDRRGADMAEAERELLNVGETDLSFTRGPLHPVSYTHLTLP